ncbi:hypothetical protein G9A89_015832 [Geosiphon pyriformis]|nr:hypothetical protein G9A89_015832 [Geosiphon pyriformis]
MEKQPRKESTNLQLDHFEQNIHENLLNIISEISSYIRKKTNGGWVGETKGLKSDITEIIKAHGYQPMLFLQYLLQHQHESQPAEFYLVLGIFYYFGVVVLKDKPQSIRFLKQAAELGDTHAQLYTGLYFHSFAQPRRPEEAFEWFRRAASGEPVIYCAKNWLGHHYYSGSGTPKNFKKACILYQEAAMEGNLPLAQLSLAWNYQKGVGVERDFFEAIKWLRRFSKFSAFKSFGEFGIRTILRGRQI